MIRYALGRLAAVVPLVILVAFCAFGLTFLTPGDAASVVAGEGATAERIAAVRHTLGLDRPIITQFGSWIGGAVRGDLGTSVVNNVDVTRLIGERLQPTLSLVAAGVLVAALIGIPSGVIAGMRPGSWIDRVVTALATLGMAVPAFWLATLLITLFALNRELLPAGGYESFLDSPGEWMRHMILPAAAIGAASAAEMARQTRSAISGAAQLDHVRTSRSLGIRSRRVVGVHVLRSASVEVVTALGLQVGRALTAAVLVEQMFAIPGLGQLTVVAVRTRDLPTVQGVVIVTAVIVLLANLVVDLSYAALNPRLRFR